MRQDTSNWMKEKSENQEKNSFWMKFVIIIYVTFVFNVKKFKAKTTSCVGFRQ